MTQYLSLEASAGSGKTFALAIRFLSLIYTDNKIEEIICLTFTKKAALEMHERIFKIINNLDYNTPEIKALTKETNINEKKLIENKDKIIKKINNSIIRIMTIDSFILKILRHYAEDIGIDKNFIIGFIDPDKEINNFVSQNNIKSEIEFLYNELNLTISDLKELIYYLYTHYFEIFYIEEQYKDINIDDLKEALSIVEKNNIQFYKIKEMLILKTIFVVFNSFVEFNIKNKKNKNIINFNDISNLTYKFILDNKKDISFLRCNHLLIDEFQDTSLLQYKIIEPFIEDIYNNNGTFFYVGDIKQSIYRFRGSNSKLFHYILNEFDIKKKILPYNYRSNYGIVDFVNKKANILYEKYNMQKPVNDKKSFIKTYYFNDYSLYAELTKGINDILKKGYQLKDITILCRNNKDIEYIYEILKIDNIKINLNIPKKLIDFDCVQQFLKDFDINKIDCEIKEIIENLILIYEDKEDLIYNIQNMKIEVETDNEGINLMTTHKSKGLEFKNVILFDYLNEFTNIEDKIFFTYDEELNPKLNIYMNNREILDNDFYIEYIKNKKQKKEDEINLYYVGITRAKENLLLMYNNGITKTHFII